MTFSCFVFSKIGRIPTDDLKDIMAGFYNAEQILSARDTLQAAVASKKIEGGPTFRGHRMSSGTALLRDNKNLDDLLVFRFLEDRSDPYRQSQGHHGGFLQCRTNTKCERHP